MGTSISLLIIIKVNLVTYYKHSTILYGLLTCTGMLPFTVLETYESEMDRLSFRGIVAQHLPRRTNTITCTVRYNSYL
jgi:hypothetical protein